MQISNCARCDRIFRATMGKRLCPSCDQKDKEEFAAVRSYLCEHPRSDIITVSEATGVPVKQIQEYLREGRLVLADGIEWLKCERCGAAITTGWLCPKCAREMGTRRAPAPREEPALRPLRTDSRGAKVIRDKWRRWD